MDDRSGHGRHVIHLRCQRCGEDIDVGEVARAGQLPLLGPAADLPREVAVGAAQGLQAGSRRIDRVEVGEGVDQSPADRGGFVGCELRGAVRRVDDAPVDEVHEHELGTDDVDVGASRVAPTCDESDSRYL